MLSMLPANERGYYSADYRVIDMIGKSKVIFEELEERFFFVNGTERNYIAYSTRSGLPRSPWISTTLDSVSDYAGFIPQGGLY